MRVKVLLLAIILMPALCLAQENKKFEPEEVIPAALTYEICGVVMNSDGSKAIGGVTISGDGVSGVTGSDGTYTITVDRGWSGTLTPSKDGFTFDPANRTYTNITESTCDQDYTAIPIVFEISGVVRENGTPLEGVELKTSDGATVVTNSLGQYSIIVSYAWNGDITPHLTGYEFTPEQRTYTNVLADQVDQDYSARKVPYFIITATAGSGGSIKPDGAVEVIEFGSQSFVIKADYGFKISDVLVGGESVGAVSSYSFSDVQSDHTIHVEFNKADNGWLKVIIKPNGVVLEGAAWRLKGCAQWLPSEAILGLEPGTYEIEYRPVKFWRNFCPIEATIFPGRTTVIKEICFEEVEAGARVHYFVADDYIVSSSIGAVLSWLVRGAEKVTLGFNDFVKSSGDSVVYPATNTVYWLVAYNENSSSSAKLPVEAIVEPRIDWFVTDATSENPVRPGEKARLMWRVHGAEEIDVSAADSDGSVSVAGTSNNPFGEKNLVAKRTRLYRLTAVNAAGEATSEAEVHVDAKPRIELFGSEHSTLLSGRQTKLSWEVVGADSVKLLPLGATVKSEGSKRVSPLQTTIYELVAENEDGRVSAECTVRVEDNATDVVLDFGKILFDGLEVNNAYAGNELEAVVTVLNDGPAPARDFDIVLSDGKYELARKRVKKIGVGGKKTVKLAFVPMEKGDKLRLTAEADPDKALPEDKRNNNGSSRQLKVLESPIAELVISDVKMTAVESGESRGLIIEFTLHNVGSVEAKNFQVDVEVDGRLVSWEAIKSLGSGMSRTFRATAAVDSPGQFSIKILADRYHAIGEMNRDNNLWQEKSKFKNIQ